MEIKEIDNNIVITHLPDFELKHTFDCGQCFRFYPENDGKYTGIAFNKAVTLSQTNDTVILENTNIKTFNDIWLNYLDLNNDYSNIKKTLSGNECMDEAIKEGFGIRILKQDLFETIVSFIISQSNNIPRIKKIIETLCCSYGNPIDYNGKIYYSFPSPEVILESDLSVLHAGYRDKYIIEAAKTVVNKPSFLDELRAASTPEAKKMLMSIHGIGNKVSDCILLFGLGKADSFPVDVWMKRIMEKLYFKRECSIQEISEYASKKFGNYSGYAQQYLFYYALNHKNELNG